MHPTGSSLNPYFIGDIDTKSAETVVRDRSFTGDYTFSESCFENCNFMGNIKFTNPNALFQNCTFRGFTTFSGGKTINCSIKGFTTGPISQE